MLLMSNEKLNFQLRLHVCIPSCTQDGSKDENFLNAQMQFVIASVKYYFAQYQRLCKRLQCLRILYILSLDVSI